MFRLVFYVINVVGYSQCLLLAFDGEVPMCDVIWFEGGDVGMVVECKFMLSFAILVILLCLW